jgi:hypothetical protein
LHDYLAQQRFAAFYPGDLPVVALAIGAAELDEIGDHLAAAFAAEPRLTVADADWADAVIELLLTPADLPMAPVTPEAAAAPLSEEEEPVSSALLPEPPLEPLPEMAIARTFAPPPRELRLEPLTDEWLYGPEERPLRQRHWGRLAAAAAGLLLLAGLGIAAWDRGDDSATTSEMAISVPKEAEVPVPPQPTTPAQKAEALAPPAGAPAVPPAQPVVLAAKPLAPLPPSPPKRTAIEPLPRVAVAEPGPPPPTPVPTPLPPGPARAAAAPPTPPTPAPMPLPPAPVRAAAAPPTPKAAEPSPPPPKAVAQAPKPARDARLTPARRRPAEHAPAAGPPIDATELPPLDQSAAPPRAGGGAGPSIAAAAQTPAAAPVNRECRPYTAESPLGGRGLAVQGIACRDADGTWRLVSEVPLR